MHSLLAILTALAIAGYVGYLVGAHRANRHWRARYLRTMQALAEVNAAMQQQIAVAAARLAHSHRHDGTTVGGR